MVLDTAIQLALTIVLSEKTRLLMNFREREATRVQLEPHLGDGTWLGVAAPAESATTGSRQLAHDQVV